MEAMDVLGILDYGLARTADLFIKHVIAPAVKFNSPVSFLEESSGSLVESSDKILKIVSSLEPKTDDIDSDALFSRMTIVVKFIHQYICLENGPWMRCFGRLRGQECLSLLFLTSSQRRLCSFPNLIRMMKD
ncbi:centromere/kinetochore protein zw10 homolog [Spinacia oleracea]|nr:centromere/kinetochore protein zw10 homolog [Spinacia oleracea]XP_056689268.1 centromere/kinetochore protein zw10 homolog [Spinacia oleracea]XP_056689884.1 centromere/kinetochore protein zw10 homolog isoform X1 [Spinacia oleracea]XP_056691514.1 centromere/kinetochore protein zw10 homolog [Spinacia oleracea]